MVFVILGTQKFQLNRLLRLLDEGAEKGSITDEIVAQTGYSDYEPKNIRCHRFLEKEDFESYISKADVVVSHSGVGSIMTALMKSKPVVVFPRLSKYGEHVDNHQTEIAQTLSGKGYVLMCDENDDIFHLIEKARTYAFNEYVSQTDRIVEIIDEFLHNKFG